MAQTPETIPVTSESDAQRRRQQRVNRAVNLGLGVNIALAAGKTFAGIAGHSQALLADGINSTSDVAYYVVVKIFVWLSGKPADKEHPYGHHQFESIAALVVGAFVVTTGIAIFWDSINAAFDLFAGKSDTSPIQSFALWVALVTVATKIALMTYTMRLRASTGSTTVSALAQDHRNDIMASVGAAVGIALGLKGLLWVDPLAGAVVALFVLKTGISILRESSAELMDAVPSDELAEQVRAILTALPGVRSVEAVHAHRFGPNFVLNVTVGVDGRISVAEGDRIATDVERRLVSGIDLVRTVYVHYHPCHDCPA